MSDLVVKKKRPKGEDGFKTFSIRIEETTVVKLDEIADKTGRKRNDLIRLFLAYAVEHHTIEESRN